MLPTFLRPALQSAARLLTVYLYLVYCLSFCYLYYQMHFYFGDGFGNLPPGTPPFLYSAKGLLCMAGFLSPWLSAALFIVYPFTAVRNSTLLNVLIGFYFVVYPVYFFFVEAWICS